MPYKLSKSGLVVMVKKMGTWTALKKHSTKQRALAHLRALKLNVKDK